MWLIFLVTNQTITPGRVKIRGTMATDKRQQECGFFICLNQSVQSVAISKKAKMPESNNKARIHLKYNLI